MKKILAMLLAVLLVFSLAACGNDSGTINENVDDVENVSSSTDLGAELEETEAEDVESKKEEIDSVKEETKPAGESKETESNAEWRHFLKDYEKWVDDYIAFMKKYNANPSDLSLLSEYSKMLADMADWTEKADEIELELEDTSESLEFSAELLRIAAKLTEATAEMY